jgi:hypothetical protein
MAAENVNLSLLPFAGKRYAVLLGVAIILLTTTVPYLTLLNILLPVGIFVAGAVALHQTIMRFQVRLPYSEAFALGSMTGLAGGVLSVVVSFLLIEFFNYTPGVESFVLVIDWMLDVAKGKPELQDQVRTLVEAKKLVLAPVQLTLTDLLMNMVVFGAFYALIAGFGGSWAVLRLKRRARRG